MVLGRDLGNKARLFRLEDLALAGKQPLTPDVELLTDTDRVDTSALETVLNS